MYMPWCESSVSMRRGRPSGGTQTRREGKFVLDASVQSGCFSSHLANHDERRTINESIVRCGLTSWHSPNDLWRDVCPIGESVKETMDALIGLGHTLFGEELYMGTSL